MFRLIVSRAYAATRIVGMVLSVPFLLIGTMFFFIGWSLVEGPREAWDQVVRDWG